MRRRGVVLLALAGAAAAGEPTLADWKEAVAPLVGADGRVRVTRPEGGVLYRASGRGVAVEMWLGPKPRARFDRWFETFEAEGLWVRPHAFEADRAVVAHLDGDGREVVIWQKGPCLLRAPRAAAARVHAAAPRLYALPPAAAGARAKAEPAPEVAKAAARLRTAAALGRTRRVDAILIDHPEVIDVPDDLGFTALMYAAAGGRTAVAVFLLESGARIDARTSDGATALMAAAINGHAVTMQVLIGQGAEVNHTDDDEGAGALHWAAGRGQTECVRRLLAAGAAVDARLAKGDRAGRTALMLAADAGHAATVRALLDARADPALKDGKGVTALALARARARPGRAAPRGALNDRRRIASFLSLHRMKERAAGLPGVRFLLYGWPGRLWRSRARTSRPRSHPAGGGHGPPPRARARTAVVPPRGATTSG